MKLKTAWWVIMIAYAIDLLIITPYALWKYNVREVGLVCSWGFNRIGYWFFPLWIIVFGFLLWIVLEGLFWVCWKLKPKYREIPKWIFLIFWCSLMTWAIINNLKIIW